MRKDDFGIGKAVDGLFDGPIVRARKRWAEKRAAKVDERETVAEHVQDFVGEAENKPAFSDQFEASTVHMAPLKAKQKADALKEQLILAIEKLNIEELEANLNKRIDRFFNKSAKYQAKHLEGFVNGLCNTIDRYEYEAKEGKDIAKDVFANIAIALASLLIFYPVVLAINSQKTGQDYGFFRVSGRSNLNYELDAEMYRSPAKEALGKALPKDEETTVDSDPVIEL